MNNKNYCISKTRKTRETNDLKLEKLTGYKIKPKVKEKGAIDVSKVVFVNDEMSEKIIRKKVDKKIEQLLAALKSIEDDATSSGDAIQMNLMEAEKLRMQLINNYVKYLGHTYHSLTLKKIELIIEELQYKLYTIEVKKQTVYMNHEEPKKEGRRGR